MAATSSSCRFVRMFFSLGPIHSERFNRLISERQAAFRPPRRFARLELDSSSGNIFKFSSLFSSLSHGGHKFKLSFCSDVFSLGTFHSETIFNRLIPEFWAGSLCRVIPRKIIQVFARPSMMGNAHN